MKLTPTLLLILDGWGQAPPGPGNAVSLARTPNLDKLLALPARATLLCSGRAVGLPDGFMGNSEVGHLNIGAGRIVYQDVTRIDMALEDGSFARTPAIVDLLKAVSKSNGVLHLMGLVSDAGVHSHILHLFALMKAAKAAGIPVAVHCFTDGRDTSPTSGAGFVRQVAEKCGQGCRIGSVTGRYYAMDRDKRWDRTQKAYNALISASGRKAADPVTAVEEAYKNGQTDEFIEPIIITDQEHPPAVIRSGDGVFMFNFRADRARQLAHALHDESFTGFDRGGPPPKLSGFVTMTHYENSLPMPVAFTREDVTQGLGQVVSETGLTQLRIAETEKYAHVTYFFNGGVEPPWPGEDRELIPSPRDVPTYDLKPQMSVYQVTEKLLDALRSGKYAFIVCNFANMDMVGHTGIIPAAIKACEAVDECVGRVVETLEKTGGRLVLTADHGNAEEMLTAQDGRKQTAHSKNPVALIIKDNMPIRTLRRDGKLGDIAPTILHLWGLPQPAKMTGQSLLEEK